MLTIKTFNARVCTNSIQIRNVLTVSFYQWQKNTIKKINLSKQQFEKVGEIEEKRNLKGPGYTRITGKSVDSYRVNHKSENCRLSLFVEPHLWTCKKP